MKQLADILISILILLSMPFVAIVCHVLFPIIGTIIAMFVLSKEFKHYVVAR